MPSGWEVGIFQTCFVMSDACVSVSVFFYFFYFSIYIFYAVSPKEQKTRNTDSTNGSGQLNEWEKKCAFFVTY